MRNAKFWINKTLNQNIEGFTITKQFHLQTSKYLIFRNACIILRNIISLNYTECKLNIVLSPKDISFKMIKKNFKLNCICTWSSQSAFQSVSSNSCPSHCDRSREKDHLKVYKDRLG